jgi:hypothetical protein
VVATLVTSDPRVVPLEVRVIVIAWLFWVCEDSCVEVRDDELEVCTDDELGVCTDVAS